MNTEISLELFVKTALALREQSAEPHLSGDELFEATYEFLRTARVYHKAYVVEKRPLSWLEWALVPPLKPLGEAAQHIIDKHEEEQALAALETFLGPELMEQCRRAGGINGDCCDITATMYQLRREAALHEAKSKGGKRAKHHLKQGPNKPENTPIAERGPTTNLRKNSGKRGAKREI